MRHVIDIPAATFRMGSSERDIAWLDQPGQSFPERWFLDESPDHDVAVDAFKIDRCPVTVADFSEFVGRTGYLTDAERRGYSMVYDAVYWRELDGASWRLPAGPAAAPASQDHPVVHMSWNDANAYAQWAGMRLPTEAEWELAATGGVARRWPWGDEWDPSRANTAELHAGSLTELAGWKSWWIQRVEADGGMPFTTAVGSFSPAGDSGFGVADMSGNVYEWTQTVSDLYPGSRGCDDALRPILGKYRVMRGGSWMNFRFQTRCAERMHGNPDGWSNFATGFRCAVSTETG